jgi:dienelactone hydrolase
MNASLPIDRLLVGLTVAALLGGCTSGANPTPAPATSTDAPSEAVATPSPPKLKVTWNVPYESADPELTPDALDVYAPPKAGPWPLVVMLHGGVGPDPAADRGNLSEYARRVADLGFVVFNASWGHAPGGADISWYDYSRAVQSQVACAVEFARAHAAEYGGDPSTMIVFGHSGGANQAAMVAFTRPAPTAGCLGGTTLGEIDALVTWEGNWLLSVEVPANLDSILVADQRVMDVNSPWTHLAEHKDQKVVMLVSEDPKASLRVEFPGLVESRPVGDPWAADSWLAVRDPSGDLRRQLEANGAFADGTIGFADSQQLLYSVLKAQGNPVTLDVLPDSSHAWLRGAGWDVFLAAFERAAAED